mmetsp:Transcript_21026/g.59808  ORF Transcript_21026/g.59808 Transcript_21026/m.59808 type:complete len:336 (+) Transcript_21026:845-1852(+)
MPMLKWQRLARARARAHAARHLNARFPCSCVSSSAGKSQGARGHRRRKWLQLRSKSNSADARRCAMRPRRTPHMHTVRQMNDVSERVEHTHISGIDRSRTNAERSAMALLLEFIEALLEELAEAASQDAETVQDVVASSLFVYLEIDAVHPGVAWRRSLARFKVQRAPKPHAAHGQAVVCAARRAVESVAPCNDFLDKPDVNVLVVRGKLAPEEWVLPKDELELSVHEHDDLHGRFVLIVQSEDDAFPEEILDSFAQVILVASVGALQHLVGAGNLGEASDVLVAEVFVRVIFSRELAVPFLDHRGARRHGHAQHLVVRVDVFVGLRLRNVFAHT